MLRITLLSVMLALVVGNALAEDDNLAPVRLQLQWVTQAQFAGYYVANELGFYEEEGLAVTILESDGDIQPADIVAAGDAEFGVTWLPKTLIANERGADLVNIAQIFQRSGTVLISFAETGIESIADLVHKTVGYWPNGNEFEVYATTFVLGSDPYSGEHLLLVEQPFHLGPLLDGELDAGQALIYNWYGRLLGMTNPATGELYQEADFNLIDMNEIGTAMLQDHIIVLDDWLAQEGNEALALGFLTATLRGWIYCRDHADDCVRILLEIDPALGESHQQWQMNEVNKLIWPAPKGIGIMDGESWDQSVEWLLTFGALDDKPAPGAYREDLLARALASLVDDGLDVTGEDWQAATVAGRAGGQ
ncbi:MAG: ABC transporter substrate-binding protein [Chloroflexi bacterium]|nr:ABC transporter substrate-binding protein [Chloroflexota bacterium]